MYALERKEILLSGTLKLPPQPKGWEHLKVNATRSLVTTPLHVFIGGEKPEEALLDGVKSCVAHTVGGVTSNYLGDLYGKGNLPYLLHKGGHFGAGFLLSLGLSEGDIEEAIGGGIAALGAEIGAESLPSSLSREARGNIAKVGGSLAGLLAGAKKGTGIFTACNAIDHNFLWTIRLAATLTPRMLAALGLSGMTAYEVGQWLKDHPMLMDMLPEGIEWEDPGFMPEESKAEVLTTPSHEDKSFILQTPIADLYSLILQTPVYDGPDTSILFNIQDDPKSAATAQRLKESLATEQQRGEKGVIIAQGGKDFRKAQIYAGQHGGNLEDWVKKSSSSFKKSDGMKIETHWVENLKTGEKYDFKPKETFPKKEPVGE